MLDLSKQHNNFNSIESERYLAIDEEIKMLGYFSNFMVQQQVLYSSISKAFNEQSKGQLDLASAWIPYENGVYDPTLSFLNLFEQEFKRVSNTITSQQRLQELSAKALLTSINTILVDNDAPSEVVLNFLPKAQELSNIALQLQQFTTVNAKIFRDIAEYADSVLGTKLNMILSRQLRVIPWEEDCNSALVVILSDIYEKIGRRDYTSIVDAMLVLKEKESAADVSSDQVSIIRPSDAANAEKYE